MSDLNKIKDRVMSLLAKAADSAASADEAQSALTMARRLMDKHGLSEAECEKAAGDDYIARDWAGRYSEKHGTIFHPVDRLCCGTIARFCGVKFWYTRGPGQELMCAQFFGLEADVALAEWMRAALIKQFDRKWEIYRDIERKNKSLKTLAQARVAFSTGFADAFNSRLEDWLYRPTEQGDGRSLIFHKQDLIQAEMDRRGIKLGHRRYAGPRVTDGLAAGAGYNAGQAAQFSQDIHHGRPQILITK